MHVIASSKYPKIILCQQMNYYQRKLTIYYLFLLNQEMILKLREKYEIPEPQIFKGNHQDIVLD